jgi:hypothetical protein
MTNKTCKEVLKAIGKIFEQEEDQVRRAFTKVRNFDTLIMYCFAAKDLNISLDEVSELANLAQVPQMYLRAIKPDQKGKGTEAKIYDMKQTGSK